MNKLYIAFIIALLICPPLQGQYSPQYNKTKQTSFNPNNSSKDGVELLQSGPMVGYSTMREVLLWVQTKEQAEVKFTYWQKSAPDQKYSTSSKITQKHDAFTAKLLADSVEPGNTYGYRLFINGKHVERPYKLTFQSQPLWQYRRAPPPFSFAVGSCAYINDSIYDRPGKAYGGQYDIFKSIHQDNPDFMLWGGDNVYLREADWNSKTGIMDRYTHTRSVDELQPLLANTHHYAIWDDHDYGPNNSDRGFWNKHLTYKAFTTFWANPHYNATGEGGITGRFKWHDVEFFLLDDRWFRTPQFRFGEDDKGIIGDAQMNWLIDALTYSRAPFKVIVIGGQVLNPVSRFENYANHYEEERRQLIHAIKKHRIEGVMFISGDRHHSELSKLEENMPYPIYDLTVSPLTSNAHDASGEENTLRVEDTHVGKRNYGVLKVSGERKDRKMEIEIKDTEGNKLWDYEIEANHLKIDD